MICTELTVVLKVLLIKSCSELSFGLFWAVFFAVLDYFGLFWTVLDCFGLFWTVLDCSGLFWAVWAC